MIAAFLIGAGVGLTAGAGIGLVVAVLAAAARIEEAQTAARKADAAAVAAERRATVLQQRCDAYVGELDALVEATRPEPVTDSWSAVALRTAGDDRPRPSFDANPTILLAPGQTYTQWYAAYADQLDREQPGWWEHLHPNAAGELVRLAEQRRHETYAQDELDQDRIPTREGFDTRHRPGLAIYPRYIRED